MAVGLNASRRLTSPPGERTALSAMAGTKGRALAAARIILANNGADELNLRAIASEAGIGLSSMYYHFSSKEDLLACLVLIGFQELRRAMSQALTQGRGETPLGRVTYAYHGYAHREHALFALMYDERLLSRHASIREAEQQTALQFQAAVEADGRFERKHAENIAAALWALGRGIAAIASSHPGGRLPKELATKIWAGAVRLVNNAKH